MYKFIDTNEKRVEFNNLPSEALFINGTAIENEIEGYRTLTVSGRELMNQYLDTIRRTSGHGSIYLRKSYPPRIITVQYELRADNNQDYRLKFEYLNKLLSPEEMELRFNDDYEHYYVGSLNGVSEVESGKNVIIGEFDLFCSDPFKYKRDIVITGRSIRLDIDDTFPTTPDKIIVKLEDRDIETITLKHDYKGIKMYKKFPGFPQNSGIVFDFVNQHVYYENNGATAMKYLDLISNFEDFYIRNDKPIQLAENGTMEIHYREALL